MKAHSTMALVIQRRLFRRLLLLLSCIVIITHVKTARVPFASRRLTPLSRKKSTTTPTPTWTTKPLVMEGPACVLDPASLQVTTSETTTKLQVFLWVIPFLCSVLAFTSFKALTQGFHEWMERVSQNTWTPKTDAEVDLQTQVITQVVNGPVITSISVLFATLVSTTISSLHHRQMQMERLFTTQIDELRLLQLIFKQLPEPIAQQAKRYTHDYTERLVREQHGGGETHTLEVSLRELLLLLQSAISQHDSLRPNKRNAAAAGDCSLLLVQMAYQSVRQLQKAQCERWTALQTRFPAMHYVTLGLLACAICASFLIATDQSLVIFKSLQVRILWTILIGSFTSLAVVCYDLSLPFAGAYQIVSKVADDELSIMYDP